MRKKKYKCLCCGYYTLDEALCDVCPVCFWEDSGITDLDVYDGLNHEITLREAITNYKEFGAGKKEWLPYVREPLPAEKPSWDDEYMVIDFEWPSMDEIQNVLNSVLVGELNQSGASTWAESIYDNKFIADKIEGYYSIEEFKGKILEKMILLDDENGDMCNEDVVEIIEMIKGNVQDE